MSHTASSAEFPRPPRDTLIPTSGMNAHGDGTHGALKTEGLLSHRPLWTGQYSCLTPFP